jgi:hypothetical protein
LANDAVPEMPEALSGTVTNGGACQETVKAQAFRDDRRKTMELAM